MKVIIRTLKGDKLNVIIQDDATVLMLKQAIEKIHTAPVDNTKLIFEGHILENDKSLNSYNIKEDSVLVILVSKNNAVKVDAEAKAKLEAEEKAKQDSEVSISGNADTPEIGLPSNGLFNSFQTQLQQYPQLFLQMLLQNPSINQMAQQNPEELQQILLDPNFMQNVMNVGESIGVSYDDSESEDINIIFNDEEKKDIDHLISLGFDQTDAVQYYLACDKNKEAAANMMMENIHHEISEDAKKN